MAQKNLTLTEDDDGINLAFQWVMALVVSAVTGFACYQLLFSRFGAGAPVWVWLIVGLFVMVSIYMLEDIVGKTRHHRRFGRVTLQLDAPAVCGGRLTGTVMLETAAASGLVELRLACERMEWQVTGKNTPSPQRHRQESVLWSERNEPIPLERGRLRVDFAVPAELPASLYPGSFGQPAALEPERLYHRWRLYLRSLDGRGLQRIIEVPVGVDDAAPAV
jgi:hypothetical protein